MKTFTSTLAALLLITALHFGLSAAITPEQNIFMMKGALSGQLVKAKQVGDHVIPVIDLPLISIKPEPSFRPADMVNGELVISGDLPVINIVAERVNNRQPATKLNGEIVAVKELPVIEITSSLPGNRIVKTGTHGNTVIPVIDLPEIIITAYAPADGELVKGYLEDGQFIATVDLPVIEITSYYPVVFRQTNQANLAYNENIEWFYVTLKNCGIDITGERICEVVSRAKTNSSTLLYSNLKTLFSR